MTVRSVSTDRQDELVKILRNLKPSAPEDELKRHAGCILMTNVFGAISDLPRAQKKGSATAKRELERVRDKAIALAQDLLGLHSEALRAFEAIEPRGQLHPLLLKKELARVAMAAQLACEGLPDTPSPKGATPAIRKRHVTDIVCKVYEELTGRRPGRSTDPYDDGRPSGPLHAFLRQVFTVLNIKGSPDAQLKAFLSSPPHGINALKN